MSASFQNSAFLNLPVSDLTRSIKFYTALGFVQNHTFSSPTAAMMSLPPQTSTTGQAVHEGAFKVMLLEHGFYGTFLPTDTERGDPRKVAQCILCISRGSREAVDEAAELAVQNGGEKDVREKNEVEKAMDGMGMYGRVMRDPDGHILETMYMPPEAYEGKE